ncbi:MAG: hypothetical protein U0822_09950 [Anaerolineae bacterium]
MISASNGVAGWKPSATVYRTLTLGILCGSGSRSELQAIRDGIGERLGGDFPPDVVRWELLDGPAGGGDSPDELRALVDDFAAPFLDLATWEQLVAERIVAGLDDGHLIPLQVLVVCRLFDSSEAAVWAAFLDTLAASLDDIFGGRTRYSKALIVMGDGGLAMDAAITSKYWPRFRLDTRASVGAIASSKRLIEAVQTLLIALITSEFQRALEAAVERDRDRVGWMTVGASALAVDIHRMERYLWYLIFRAVMQPLVQSELSSDDERFLQQVIESHTDGFEEAMLEQALAGALALGWRAKREGTELRMFDLDPMAELWRQMTSPTEEAPAVFTRHLVRLREALAHSLPPVADAQYARLVELFEALLDPRRPYGGFSLSLPEPRPSGLAATVRAVRLTADRLQGAADIRGVGSEGPSLALTSDSFLAVTAAATSDLAVANALRYRRLRRSIASPQDVALKLAPAWLLLSDALSLAGGPSGTSAAVSGIALGLVGMVEYAAWRRRAASLQAMLREEAHRRLRTSSLTLMKRVMADQRQLAIGRLSEVFFGLERLHSLLLSARKTADEEEHEIRREVLDAERGSVYWLVDVQQCEEWAARAIEEAKEKKVLPTLIADNVFPLLRAPTTYRVAANAINERISQLAADQFISAHFEPYILADRERLLKDGRRWSWLYERAVPLGKRRESDVRELTVITLAGNAGLKGAGGETSEYWRRGWLVARSSQLNEIACLRCVIELHTAATPEAMRLAL